MAINNLSRPLGIKLPVVRKHRDVLGDAFTLADAAAAPKLFYADGAYPIGQDCILLRACRAGLLAGPSFARRI